MNFIQEYCDRCNADVPDGEGYYPDPDDGERVCQGCFNLGKATERRSHIGSMALYTRDELTFTVNIINERFNYGRRDVLIEPAQGSGSKWVAMNSVKTF